MRWTLPSWIPQSFVTIGLALIALMIGGANSCWRCRGRRRARRRARRACDDRSWSLVILPALLLLMGVPIFVVLMAATLGGILLSINPVQAIHSAMFGSLDIFPLLAVPLFIYAGDIMARGGIARRLIELILSLVGARARLARHRHHRRLRGVQRDVGIERRLRRGDRQAHDPVAEEERLRRHASRSAW